MNDIRVRFAPSPTGALHMGGVRTALFNYLFAKKNNGKIILRIEDTDQNRFVPNAEEYIIKSLKWCGLDYDEGVDKIGDYGPYRQSERKQIYIQYVNKLIELGHAYYAFDTPEELDEMRKKLESEKSFSQQYGIFTRMNMKNSLTMSLFDVKRKIESGEPYVVRCKIPENQEIVVNDLIKGVVKVNSFTIDDKVLFKSDGMPTYHLASVVDDYLMKISHVIRGEEWLPSAPLHVLLYGFLGIEDHMPKFAHLPLILKTSGKGKLGKRDGVKLGIPVIPLQWTNPETKEVFLGYRECGYFPEAFINMLALLGWNPGTNQEIFSLKELIDSFSFEHVGKSGCKFDIEKAKWYNQQYIRQKSEKELASSLIQFLQQDNIICDLDFAVKVVKLMKDRIIFVKDIISQSIYFFKSPDIFNQSDIPKVFKPNAKELLLEFKNILQNLNDFNPSSIENKFRDFITINSVGFGLLMNVFRFVITGELHGPSMFDICYILGKNEVVSRIDKSLNILSKSL